MIEKDENYKRNYLIDIVGASVVALVILGIVLFGRSCMELLPTGGMGSEKSFHVTPSL